MGSDPGQNLPHDCPFTTADEAAELFANAYRKFIYCRVWIDGKPNKLINPSEFSLPTQGPSLAMAFAINASNDYVRLAANRTNEFCATVIGLRSWQEILNEYKRDEGII